MTVLAAGVVLHRSSPEGPRLLLLRNRDNGHWGLPKGRRDPEDPHEIATALREVEEETGWRLIELHASFRFEHDYVVRGTADAGRRKRVVYFLAKSPTPTPRLSAEHAEFHWACLAELDDFLAYAQLRDVARRALAALSTAPA